MTDSTREQLIDPLTERELDILHRMADRRSDREIAQEFFLSVNTIKWHNRQIYSKLAVNSRAKAVAKAHQIGLLEERQTKTTVPEIGRPKHNLPIQFTSFFGRQHEIEELTQSLDMAHLLCLTGPGGVGKTRLALEAAASVVGDFKDGVFFVDLASINQPHLLASTIASAIGALETPGRPIVETLIGFLQKRHVLLVLDNFEHIIEAAPLVGDLLASAPSLRIVVTSREALRLYGEQEYQVQPLSLPGAGAWASISDFSQIASVALFIDRAKIAKSGFEVKEDVIPAIAEICRRLDGLPLAIELAAARVKLLNPQALLEHLQGRFTALQSDLRGQPARHRTLGSAIRWSFDLLDEEEQTLFARLSVFGGGRSIEAVEDISCDDLTINVVDGLESLLDKNLLRIDEGPDGEPRFTMLETIHEFSRDQLDDLSETEMLRSRHADYFTHFVERAEPYTRGGHDQMRWLRRLDAEHENLRLAFEWSRDGGDLEFALRLVGALGYAWWRLGWYSEGQQWTEWAIMESTDASLNIRANVLYAAGIVSHNFHMFDEGKRRLSEALALYREIGSQQKIGWTLAILSYQSIGQAGEYESALSLADDSLAVMREINDQAGIAQALNITGELARVQGDIPRATEAYRECLAVAREIGDRMRETFQLLNLAFIAQHEGRPEEAQSLAREGLTIALDIGHTAMTADKFSTLAGIAVALKNPKRAARLYGAADRLYEEVRIMPQAADMREFERDRSMVHEQLGAKDFQAAWSEGWELTLEEAIAYALGEELESRDLDKY